KVNHQCKDRPKELNREKKEKFIDRHATGQRPPIKIIIYNPNKPNPEQTKSKRREKAFLISPIFPNCERYPVPFQRPASHDDAACAASVSVIFFFKPAQTTGVSY